MKIENTVSTCNYHLKRTRKRFPCPQLTRLLFSVGLLLAWAGSALATTYDLNGSGVTYNASSLSPTPGSGDTIIVHNGATLGVDVNLTVGTLTIGDVANTPGQVLFPGTPATAVTLTVGNVTFIGTGGNIFDLAHASILDPAHTVNVSGAFLTGTGTFFAGNSTVNYNALGAQTVTPLVYKNLTLSGSGNKTLSAAVSIQGVLTLAGGVPTGATPTYGLNASLVYNGTANTTAVEWPQPAGLSIPVTISSSVTLNADKSISGLLTLLSGNLNDNGFTLTVLGNINNGVGLANAATKIQGKGKILLAGTSAQTLAGNGSYGNVTLQNAAGATLDAAINTGMAVGSAWPPTAFPKIAGRLILTGTGKLTVPVGENHGVSLLTYGGVDRISLVTPPNIYGAQSYGSSSSGAAIQDDTAFQDGGTPRGILTVNAKPPGVIAVTSPTNPKITYGTPTITVTGTVKPPTGTSTTPDFSVYGNNAVAGENVIVTIMPPTPFAFVSGNAPIQADNQSFSVTVNVSSLPTGWMATGSDTPFNMMVTYDSTSPRPLNLAGNTLPNPPATPGSTGDLLTLTITRMFIVVTPENIGKVYGTPDTALMVDPYLIPWSGPGSQRTFPFTFTTGQLVNGDTWSGALGRTPGENVGGYAINQGTFTLNANYELWFITGKALTIIQKGITVIPDPNQQKVYGTADPVLTFTVKNTDPTDPSTPLVAGDSWTGALSRVPGEAVGPYNILIGTLAPLTPGFGSGNYNVTFTSGVQFNITKLHIVITIANNSKIYGEVDPPLGIQSVKGVAPPFTDYTGGLPNGDTVTGTPARDAGENAGTYAIRQGTLAVSPAGNYIVDYVNGTFTINKRPVYVTGDSGATKYYGDNMPTLVFYENANGSGASGRGLIMTTRNGLPGTVNGQTSLPGVTINWQPPNGAATVCSLPNVYTFLLSGSDGNYAITYQYAHPAAPNPPQPPGVLGSFGQLTVSKAPMKIVADNQTKVANGAVFNPVDFTSKYWVLLNGVWTQEFMGSTPQTPPGTPNNCGDTAVTAFNPNQQDGLLAYDDNHIVGFPGDCPDTAVTATTAGVYEIRPYITGSAPYGVRPPSDRFDVHFVSGYLTISPATLPSNTSVGSIAWGSSNPASSPPCNTPGDMVNLTWFADAPDFNTVGTAGGEPGWSLLTVGGTLTINATPACPFRLDLVTLASGAPGRMAMFDPTRPYKWLIVQTTGGIAMNPPGPFDPTTIRINYNGSPLLPPGAGSPAYLFQNPIFGGQFSVGVIGNNMYLYFTPVGPTGHGSSSLASDPPLVPIPPGYVNNGAVGPITDPTTLLGDTDTHGVPTLWLQAVNPVSPNTPGPVTLQPNTPITINLNVADLGTTDIYGCQAYINFSSLFFNAGTGVGAPQVAAGGGVWQNLIFRQWNVGGDMDTVIGIQFDNLSQTGTGTHADATVATITLTPTRTAVGTSRVVFRHDGDPYADGTGALQTALIMQPGQTVLLPARIMSDEITVVNSLGPVVHSIKAQQSQPYSDATKALPALVDVKGGPPGAATTVRTFGGILHAEATTASGPVVITIDADDNGGVGLSGPPTLTLTKTTAPFTVVPLTCVSPGPGATVGPFVYNWTVPVGADGTWTATGQVCDTINPGPNCLSLPSFNLVVNTHEVACVVELQNFAGSNRVVTFNAGNGLTVPPANGVLRSWSPNLNFISGPILSAGAYQDRAAMDARLSPVIPQVDTVTPADPLSIWLRYGGFPHLDGVVDRLRLEMPGVHKNVDVYINNLLYGYITDLPTLAARLANPVSRIDQFAALKLSPTTLVALAAYEAHGTMAAHLTAGILDDFNENIVGTGVSIWDGVPTVRFQGVAGLSPTLTDPTAIQWLVTTPNTAMGNRTLLHLAFPQYVPGMLNPAAGIALTDNAHGQSTPALQALLLKAFDDLTLNVFNAPDPVGRTTMWPINGGAQWQGGATDTTYVQGLYSQTVFVNVALAADTHALLVVPQVVPALTQLNRDLLVDAYTDPEQFVQSPEMYQEARLRPDTVQAVLAFNPTIPATVTAFDTLMQRDLNVVIFGPSIWDNGPTPPYNSQRFAPWQGGIMPGGELAQLIATPSPSAAQLVRLNRLLLELGYSEELSESVLAPYILVNAPPTMTQLSAKTAWNLRETLTGLAFDPVTLDITPTANFVNAGEEALPPHWIPGVDHYLRGGDINGDNMVSLADYNGVRVQYQTPQTGADINGDGMVTFDDYRIMKMNWAKTGAPEVQ
jgi:hypothetical protein